MQYITDNTMVHNYKINKVMIRKMYNSHNLPQVILLDKVKFSNNSNIMINMPRNNIFHINRFQVRIFLLRYNFRTYTVVKQDNRRRNDKRFK